MAIVDPDRDQGKALFEGSQSFEDHDDISDHKTGSVYDHDAKEFSATEAESWCDLLRYIIEHSKDGLLALPVRNETGGTIVAATSPLVYVTGYSDANDAFTIAKADATDASKIAQFVLIADLANNTNGVAYANSDEVAVTYPADVRTGGLDTSGAAAVGDVVYTSTTTPGAWQYSAPASPNFAHAVGRVIVKDAANGEILFYPGGVANLPAHTHAASDITSGTLVHERGGLEADVSAGDGFVQIKSGATAVIKTNHAATTAPGTGNDNTQGYAIGSRWIDVTADKEYVALDVSTGAAVWTETTGSGGGVGGSGMTLAVFTPAANEPPTSNYATLDTRNNHPVLEFDQTTNESAVFSGVLPNHYQGGGLTVRLLLAFDGITTGDSDWDAAFERIDAGTLDIDGDSFAAVQSTDNTSVPGTDGVTQWITITFTDGAQMDSLAAGEAFRLKITRDAASDTAAADAQLLRVEIRET